MAEPAILLVTDDRQRSNDVLPMLPHVLRAEATDLGVPVDLKEGRWKAVLFDVDFNNIDTVRKISVALVDVRRNSIPFIFLVARDTHHARVQAAAFGGNAVLGRPINPKRLEWAILGPPEPEDPQIRPEIAAASKTAEQVIGKTFDALRKDKPLDIGNIAESSEQIDAALGAGPISEWFDAVRQHHSHTYRHCMLVAGVVAAFVRDIGIGGPSRQKLIQGALMHDIGKAKIPVEILDKPTALSSAEMAMMREHPAYGRRFLMKHHGHEAGLIDMVYLHHEFLDGSGYPLKLKGRAIPDAVRITTLCDIYSALTEPRAYKRAYSNEEAYDVMAKMSGKLDPDLMRVFAPLVLQ